MTRPTALVLITSSFPIRNDGSEAAGSFVADLAEELSNHLPVRVVAPGSRIEHQHWSETVQIFRYQAPRQPMSTLRPWWPNDFLSLVRVVRSGAKSTLDAVSAGPTAHILALWALPGGHWARKVSRVGGVPYSVWTLGSDIWTLGRIPFIRQYIRRILRGARSCYSDGFGLADETSCISGREVDFLPSTRRIVGKRTEPLRSAPPYRLLFLGRWHPNKGVDLLLDALSQLNDEDWQRVEVFEICGGGPLNAVVQSGIESLRAAGRPVAMRSYLPKLDAEEAILSADFLVIPSRIESIPLIFSDAMKCGTPVIANPTGDLPRLIQTNSAGILATEVSSCAFAKALREALYQGPRSFSESLTAAAAIFSLENVALRLLTSLDVREPALNLRRP